MWWILKLSFPFLLLKTYNLTDASCAKSPTPCPSGWAEHEDNCYRFIQKEANWSAAQFDCRRSGGNLVKIDDEKENGWIKDQTKENKLRNPWIGLYEYSRTDWRWVVDFHVPLFFGWYTENHDEPNGDGNCGQLLESLQFEWNDEPCTKTYSYICERSCSAWIEFGSCSVTCGTGRKLFIRHCNNPVPENSELSCPGDTVKYEDCNLGGCPGSWGCWQAVGQCSATCGNGTQLRVRECNNSAPTYGGPTCKGENSSNVWCNIRDCPVFKWGYLKEMNFTKSELLETLKEELNELKSNLTVDTKNTSAAIRLRTSARDERPSAASVGYIAIVLLSIPFTLMICCDCSRLFQTNSGKAALKVAVVENVDENNESKAGPSNGEIRRFGRGQNVV